MRTVADELTELSTLIDLIYQGATDPNRWQEILATLSDYVDAPYGFLVTPMHAPASGGYMYTHNLPAGVFETWPRFVEHDVYAQTAAAKGLFDQSGAVVTGEDLVTREEFLDSVFYKDFLSHYDMAYMTASIVFGTEEHSLLPTTCTFYRRLGGSAFSEVSRQRQQLIIPHLSRALGVMQKLRDADLKVAASRSTLDVLSAGVLLIGISGEVVFANRRALQILREEDGLLLRSNSGRQGVDTLTARDAKSQIAINTALNEAISPHVLTTPHFSRSVCVHRPSSRPPYILNFSSLPLDNEFGSGNDVPRAIVFLADPEQPQNINTELLRSIYRLTPAEVRAAALLAEGEPLEEIAFGLGVKITTLKTQLQQIYIKTGVNTRAKLVRLLLSLSRS